MRKLVIILLVFLAVVTLITALDNSGGKQAFAASDSYEQASASNF